MFTILVVDDDPQAAWTLSKLLETMGYHSLFLLESEYLFQMLEQRRVDLILLDITMPGADGLSLLTLLKHHPRFQEIPVIMLTDGDEEKLLECVELGALDFINKPVKKKQLHARMKLISNSSNTACTIPKSI